MPDDDTPWLDAAELDDWIPFQGMLITLPAALDAQLQRDAGMSLFSYSVLAGLSESPDRTLRMSDLAQVASGSLSRLSHTIARLERKGWVRRHPLPEDGRITLASLTDEGFATLRAAAPAHVRTVRALALDAIGPDGLRELGEASRAILDRLGIALPPR